MSLPDYEERRVSALRRFGLLDSPPEEVFDGITLALANVCAVPIALITLVDSDRQWFKSAYGMDFKETPRDSSICSFAIQSADRMTVIEDASQDVRFASHPLVTQEPYVRFYAGKPILNVDGYPLGVICVIDTKPRKLETYQLVAFEALAVSVTGIFAERYRMQQVAIDRDNVETVLRQRVNRYQQLCDERDTALHGVLDWLDEAVAVVNANGLIIGSNKSWINLVSPDGGEPAAKDLASISVFAEKSLEIAAGCQEILSGKIDRFELTIPRTATLFKVLLTPYSNPPAGAIVQLSVAEPH